MFIEHTTSECTYLTRLTEDVTTYLFQIMIGRILRHDNHSYIWIKFVADNTSYSATESILILTNINNEQRLTVWHTPHYCKR